MPTATFSARSATELATCDDRLVAIFERVIALGFDCTILEGRRGKAAQDEAYHQGRSQKQWPDGNHNCPIVDPTKPSATWLEDTNAKCRAVDAAPYPVDWKKRERFIYFAGIVKGVAAGMGIKLRWGGDWNGNLDPADESFSDLVHFELLP